MGGDRVSWCAYKPIITVTDLLDSGACASGVIEAVVKHNLIAAKTENFVDNSYAARAAIANGNGYGDGYGNGNGYGDGYGNGNGYGNGYGYGYGYGYGNGYGYGDGNGDGYGDGNGDGYG